MFLFGVSLLLNRWENEIGEKRLGRKRKKSDVLNMRKRESQTRRNENQNPAIRLKEKKRIKKQGIKETPLTPYPKIKK